MTNTNLKNTELGRIVLKSVNAKPTWTADEAYECGKIDGIMEERELANIKIQGLLTALRKISNINTKSCEKYVAIADGIAVDALVAFAEDTESKRR